MSRLKIQSKGVLYRNPLPGHRAINATLANVLCVSEHRLVCVFRIGSAFYSPDGRIHCIHSDDGGESWSSPQLAWPEDKIDTRYNYTAPELSRLRDGTLVLTAFRADQSNPDHLFINAQTGGLLPAEILLSKSTDGGRSWSPPQVMRMPKLPGDGVAIPNGSVIELDDGTWFLGLEGWKRYDEHAPRRLTSFAAFSNDQGCNWNGLIPVADGQADGRSFSHGRYTRLADGRLFAMLWTGNTDMSQTYDLHAVFSRDEAGRDWSRPQSTGIQGQTSWTVSLNQRRMAMIYTQRDHKRPGLRVVLSEDGGQSWDLDNQILVWDAYGRESLGVSRTATYPSSHDAIAYGKPQLARINDTEFITAFWCTQSGDTHIRYARIQVEHDARKTPLVEYAPRTVSKLQAV